MNPRKKLLWSLWVIIPDESVRAQPGSDDASSEGEAERCRGNHVSCSYR